MDTVSRDRLKQRGFKRFLKSFIFAKEGIKYAINAEQNMLIHIFITVLVVSFGFIFRICLIEWLFCILMIALVIGTELINSSIEAVVDLTSPKKNHLAKIAKDTASGSVLIFSLAALIIGLIIFVPKIVMLLCGEFL